jgi:hypothetical protein
LRLNLGERTVRLTAERPLRALLHLPQRHRLVAVRADTGAIHLALHATLALSAHLGHLLHPALALALHLGHLLHPTLALSAHLGHLLHPTLALSAHLGHLLHPTLALAAHLGLLLQATVATPHGRPLLRCRQGATRGVRAVLQELAASLPVELSSRVVVVAIVERSLFLRLHEPAHGVGMRL